MKPFHNHISSRVLKSQDPFELEEWSALQGWEIQYLPSKPRKFDTWFCDRELPRSVLQWESWNAGMQLLGKLQRDLVPIALPIGSRGVFQSMLFNSGNLIFMKPGSDLNLLTQSPVQLLTLHVPKHVIEGVGVKLGIENPMALLSGSQIVECAPSFHQHWLKSLITLCQIPPEFKSAREEMESQLFCLFWEYLSHQNGRETRLTENPTGFIYPIKCAQEFVEENLTNTVCLEDIVVASGISARMLQLCFRKYFQMTPMQYLRWRRMHCAHRVLQESSSHFVTVTQVAMTYGFFHVSRFSEYYKHMFGELPSETLNGKNGKIVKSRLRSCQNMSASVSQPPDL